MGEIWNDRSVNPTNTLKVSVLATGELVLDGQPVTLPALEQALGQATKDDTVVWYYRENAAGDPPAVVAKVMNLIAANRLPVRFSSRPDFSDTVTLELPDLEKVFRPLREKAAQGQLVILRPDGRVMQLPALPKESTPPQAIASVERMLPSSVKRNVVAVGDVAWALADAPDLRAANRAIPFFGLLMGFSTIGHAVWIFDSSASAVLAAGCREADVLIVDSQRLAELPPPGQDGVKKTKPVQNYAQRADSSARSALGGASLVSRVDQHAGIQNRVRVEGALGRLERAREALGPLAVVPWAMVTADRMMVRDRPAELD